MAIPTLNAVGFCANFSQQGDWAFDYALRLSQKLQKQLNVFHFLSNPYDPNDTAIEQLPHEEKEIIAIEKEKKLRLYYDQKAGEYLKVGFRVCYDRSWTELHRCLIIREFQLLVLAMPSHEAIFANKPIFEFAESFISPVILVGSDRPNEYYLNSQAALIADKLCIKDNEWSRLDLATA
jgi:hypothetical protein